MFSRTEYNELNKKKKKDPPVSMEAVRAAPQMEVLTNSEEWNKYLSYVEPLLEKAKARAGDVSKQLLDPSLFDTEKLFQLKSEYIRMTERIEVLEVIMSFPKQIIEYGKVVVKGDDSPDNAERREE